jgi:hypothetical protein
MVRINGNSPNTNQLKAQEVPNTELDQLNAKLEEALAELEQVQEYYHEYLDEATMIKLETYGAMMRAQCATIDAIKAGVDGTYPAGTNPGEAGYDYESQAALENLGSGWSENAHITEKPEHASAMQPEDGEYMGTVIVNTVTGQTVNPLGFSIDDNFEQELFPGGSIEQVILESRGKDIVFTVVGLDSNGQEQRFSWVFQNGSTNTTPIIINANYLSHGIDINAVAVLRMAEPGHGSQPGVARGLYIWGTEHKDTIQGSQAGDKIAALGGNDTIYGWGGDDVIYGDFVEDPNNPSSGGDDTIHGGVGVDMLYGGDFAQNGDTCFESDVTAGSNPGVAHSFENIANDVAATIPTPGTWVDTDWDMNIEDGMLVLTNQNTSGGYIDFNMEDIPGDVEYTMCFAELDSNGTDGILNFVGRGPNGEPMTFKVKIEGLLVPISGDDPNKIIRVTLNGSNVENIIDVSGWKGLTSQVVNINGMGGDDIIVNAENALLADGVSYDSLTSTTEAGATVNGYVTDGIFYDQDDPDGRVTEQGNFNATTNSNGEIVIGEINNPDPIDPNTDYSLRIVAPEGYEQGYIALDPHEPNPADADLLVVLYNPTTGKTIIIRISDAIMDNYQMDFSDLMVSNIANSSHDSENQTWDNTFGTPWALTPISLNEADYVITGGAGNDIAYGLKGTNFDSDIEYDVEFDPDLMNMNEVENTGGGGNP